MRLVRPKAELTVGQDGVVDWAMRPSAPVDPGQITIENLSVVEGQLLIQDTVNDRQLSITEINANISARSLKGPWRSVGSLRVNGRRTTLTATTGANDGSGTMSLSLSANPEIFPVKIDTDGVVTNDKGALGYSGEFRVAGVPGVQSELRDGDGKTARAEPQSARNRATGKFRLTSSRFDVDQFRFESGPLADPYSAEGSAFVDLGADPRFLIEATGQQFRIEDDQNGATGGKTFGERLQDIEDTLALIPEPTIAGSVDISLPAIVAGATTIRDLKLSARPEDKGWRILSASAQLPGRSTLEADGRLIGGEAPRFIGNLLLAVRQPTGFAAWLSEDIEDAMRTLPAAGFRAKVAIDRLKQTFSDMELILGPTKLTGAIERTSLESAKPVVVARLGAEMIDADTAAAFLAMASKETVREHDLDFSLKADSVAVGGVKAGAIDAALRLTGERLDVDRLSIGDLSGASVAATGSVRDLRGRPLGDLDITVTATDLTSLIHQFAQWMPGSILAKEMASRADVNPGLFSDARIDVICSLAAETSNMLPGELALSLSGAVGGSTLQGSATAKVADINTVALLETRVELANDEATPLLALAGLPTLPVVSLGPGKLSAEIRQKGAGSFTTTAEMNGDDFQLRFDGESGRREDAMRQLSANGRLVLKAEDVEPWLLVAGAPLPGMGFGMSADLQADADFSNGLLVLNSLSGVAGDTAVSGDVNLEFSKGRPDISGELTLDALDLEPLTAALLGGPSLVNANGTPWPDSAFVKKTVTAATADLDLTVGTLAAGILPPLHDASLSLKAGETQLSLSDIKATAAAGSVGGHVEISNEGGNGLVSGQLTLKDADLALVLQQAGLEASALSGRATISASFGASGPSVTELVRGLAGSGVIELNNLVVSGLNSAALPELIRQADALGQGIDDTATSRFAPGVVKAGSFDAGDATFAFNLASGVFRAPPTRFDRDQALLTAEGRIDLNAQTVDVATEFALKPGDEALVGAEPTARVTVNGPVNAPQVALDTSGLAQFLTQRQLEIEQARVEAMQAAILEKQRLRREAAYFAALNARRAAVMRTETLERAELGRLMVEAESRRLQEEAHAKAKAEAAAKSEVETKKPEPAKPVKATAKPPLVAPKKPEPKPQAVDAPVGDFPPPPVAPPASDFGDSDFDG
jgi:uncharacterized protein involved in outer membrane biogenesis